MVIVAIKERSEGNESVGTMWLDTKIFSPETPVSEILSWAVSGRYSGNQKDAGKYGRLMLTVAEEPSK